MPFANRPTLPRVIPSVCLLSLALAGPTGAQTFTYLYTFDPVNYANGAYPNGNLAIDRNGVLYGTTQMGGVYSQSPGGADEGCGTVYSLTPPASRGGPWTETVLWSFGGHPNRRQHPVRCDDRKGGVPFGVAGGGSLRVVPL